jgi:hypothetical protein
LIYGSQITNITSYSFFHVQSTLISLETLPVAKSTENINQEESADRSGDQDQWQPNTVHAPSKMMTLQNMEVSLVN